jgi:hypothetical protein
MEATLDVHNLLSTKDHQLANLLGLEVTDYRKLSHTGFRTITGLDGKPMHFYTVISPLNPKPILERLKPKMNKTNTIYIPAEAIKIKDLPEDMIA